MGHFNITRKNLFTNNTPPLCYLCGENHMLTFLKFITGLNNTANFFKAIVFKKVVLIVYEISFFLLQKLLTSLNISLETVHGNRFVHENRREAKGRCAPRWYSNIYRWHHFN